MLGLSHVLDRVRVALQRWGHLGSSWGALTGILWLQEIQVSGDGSEDIAGASCTYVHLLISYSYRLLNYMFYYLLNV